MIIYNVTLNIDDDIHDEWLKWMKEKHIPDVMRTGLFLENRMLKLLMDEPQGKTYSMQYTLNNMADLEEYRAKHAPRLQKELIERYADKFVAFRTVLEVV
ncbi:MAG: DUF4286 family protein [Bacteroidia bacterium]|nr:DUF4286 family protein [Bacteroidia bacterium]